jgi:hemerythrin-like domain-containing protein
MKMKYASEDLINEHEGILFGLKILKRMAERLVGNTNIEIQDYYEIVNFLKLFADKCHHGKEEGFLFSAMEKAGIQKENGPIGQMLYEHTIGRKYIAEMSGAMTENNIERKVFIEYSEKYVELLRSHIEKENKVLFPMGDKKIPESEQKKLIESFETFKEEVMGIGTHEKLHKMLNAFEAKYLNP